MKKIKVSKRVLSVVLAALMVVTSVPLIAFTASADSNLDSLTAAMNYYVTSMNTVSKTTNKVYTSLKPAYDAYVAAQKQYDSLKYGGVDNGAAAAASKLNDEVTKMMNSDVSFDVYKGTAVPTFGTNAVDSYYYSNLLYAPSSDTSNRPMNDNNDQGIRISMYSPPAVMLYDGVNETSAPVILDFQRSKSMAFSNWVGIHACYPSASVVEDGYWNNSLTENDAAMNPSTIFVLGGANGTGKSHRNWKAWHPTRDVGTDFQDCVNATSDLHYPMGTNNNNLFTTSEMIKTRSSTSGSSYWGMAINKIMFVGDPDLTSATKTYKPAWTTVRTYNNNNIYRQIHHGSANNYSITVINFSKIREAMGQFASTVAKYDISKYKEGGLADLFAAMDAISAVKPMDYFRNGTDTNGLVSKINDLLANSVPKLTAAYTTDSADYKELRDTFDGDNGIVNTYNAGNANKVWTDDTWDTFSKKYQAAQRVMSDVVANGYTGDAITAKNELIDAKAKLQTVVYKVNSTALEAAIDDLLVIADTSTFTVETVNQAVTAANNAKIAVWGAVADYKNDAQKLDDSTTAQRTVETHIVNIENAKKALRFTPAYQVSTELGVSSLKALLDEYPSLKADEKDYVGFPEYEEMYGICKDYADSLATKELLDFDAQNEEYTAMVLAFLEVRQNLHITFLKAPDGTFIREASLSPMVKGTFQGKGQSDIFYGASIRYPQGTVLFKTTHDAKDLKFGEAVMTWETRHYNHYQILDSITFHDTTVLPEGYTNDDFFNEFHSKTWVAIGYGDSAIPADKADRYSTGDLSGERAEMTNVKIISRAKVPLDTPYAQLGNGSVNYTRDPNDPRLTELIATTDANVEDEHCGGIAVMSVSKEEQAVVTFTGDMIAHTPSTPKYDKFEDMPLPSDTEGEWGRRADSYGIYGNVGALYKWKTYGVMNSIIMGYSYIKLQDISSSCYVVDISYLIDLINMVADTPEAPYTVESYTKFRDALNNAKSDYPYTAVVEGAADPSLGANNVAVAMMNRYDDLYKAYRDLEYKTFDISFNYKDATGKDTNSVVKATYNQPLSAYQQQIADISTPAYTEGGYKYTFDGWDPEPNLSTTVTGDLTFTAKYKATELPANWTNYNAARSELLNSLATRTYTAADLQKVQSTISYARFFAPSTHTPDIMSSSQGIIDAEAEALRAAIPQPASIDADAANAALELKKATTDKDQYDVSVLDSFKIYKEVTVNGTVYEGFIYNDQAALDTAVKTALDALNSNAMQYDVYLNGSKVNTDKVPYGTPVIVNSDGSIVVDAPDLDKDANTDYVAWYYSHSAPSTNSKQTADKYMTTSPSIGFILKGDTYLSTKSVTESENGYAVRFVRGTNNKVFDVVYTDADGNFTVPSAPKLAYYSFTGYSVDGVTAGATFNVSKDTTIVANYAPQTANTYTVNIMTYSNGIDPADAVIETGEYAYNDKVSIDTSTWLDDQYISEDIYVWCQMIEFDPDEYSGVFVPVYYGSDYSFYACKDIDLVAFSKTEFEDIYQDPEHLYYFDTINTVGTSGELYGVSVEDKFVKVIDEDGNLNKVSMIGTFVLPNGYKMVETGMLLGPVGAPLQVENAGTDGIKRAKSTKFTPGNQFVLSLKVNDTNIGTAYDYAAYAIVELPDGSVTTLYSQTKTDTVAK